MKKLMTLLAAVALVGSLAHTALAAGDTLAEVKKKGVLVAGVKDSLPRSATSTRSPARSSATTSTSSKRSPRSSA